MSVGSDGLLVSDWRPSWLHSYSGRGLDFMLAVGSGDSWGEYSLRPALFEGAHCPLCGDTGTWAEGPWTHFFVDCRGARRVLAREPSRDWILLLSTAVSPVFALFSAASTFADAAGRLLGYIDAHGDVSAAALGERQLEDL